MRFPGAGFACDSAECHQNVLVAPVGVDGLGPLGSGVALQGSDATDQATTICCTMSATMLLADGHAFRRAVATSFPRLGQGHRGGTPSALRDPASIAGEISPHGLRVARRATPSRRKMNRLAASVPDSNHIGSQPAEVSRNICDAIGTTCFVRVLSRRVRTLSQELV